jgi:hypothetical protein
MFSASGLRGISQFMILGCGWMLVIIIVLEQRVVGVVGLDAAGSRIRMPSSEALGHVWGMNQETRGDNSGIEGSVIISI